MALDRTVFNAWVDDDGSGATGTLFGKTEIAGGILDPVDAEILRVETKLTLTEQTTTATGDQDDFDLDARVTYLRCNNASALVFTGFTVDGSAPQSGDLVIIDNVGSSTVKVAHQDTGSTDVNRAIGASAVGQIIGANGRMQLVYDGTTDRWRIALIDPGAPIAVAFDAGHFTANGSMTWTVASGDVVTFAYSQTGKTMTVWFYVQTTTVAGTLNTSLQITIPAGATGARFAVNGAYVNDNGTASMGFAQVSDGGTVITVVKVNVANFSAATDTTGVRASITFEID